MISILYRYLYGCQCMHYYWSLLIHVFEKIYRNYHNVNSTEKCLNSIKNQFGKHLYAQIMNSDAMINILSYLMLIWLHEYTYHWCPKHTQNVIAPGQPFKYLGHYHITSKKFLEPPEVEKCLKNGPKLRNFESLSWLWKTRFGLWRFLWSLASLIRFVMSRFDVRWKSLGLGQPFKYLERYHITSKKVFRATWSWKMPQILFVRSNWDFRNFWVLVSFWGIFQLQVVLKKFLRVIW